MHRASAALEHVDPVFTGVALRVAGAARWVRADDALFMQKASDRSKKCKSTFGPTL
ncbi:hypothetical protein [Microvirga sp. 2YAF29]|uniref:hypothetical protein n=1 Tax=Microvirga sp. 2YAF29 TaxID=3233031 RepID=UPI003F9E8A78